ncbi:hypothetical protein [Cellulophaga sp. Asnod2-G02]|uniref:hypothetical protein n=1 Tax=Cellulophaga sp. Asnod2-G02 TaxID=3160572 RepID=UPI0038706F9C
MNQWTILPIGNTFIWWTIYLLILIFIFKIKPKYYDINNEQYLSLVKLYIFWNIVCVIRGFFVAQDYWEWKQLISSSLIFLLPIIIFVSTHRLFVQNFFSKWISFAFPIFSVFILFTEYGAYGRYLFPMSILLIFLPLLQRKWIVIILANLVFVSLIDLGARSNVIKFIVPFAFGLLYYMRPFVGKKIIGLGCILLLGLPIILFILGLTGQFNVFKISDYIKGSYTSNASSGEQEDLTADTRTGLYIEVLSSAILNDYVWLGRTPARGNDSVLFGAEIEAQTNSGKFERYANEVSILNIFTWTGIIGVILYFLVFIKATYLALNKSKSWYMKILALYLCFRWSYAWVEDFSRFDLSYTLLWIIIGMCYSSSFRNMTDREFKYWVRGIFDTRYRKATLKKVQVIKQS